MVKRDGTGAVRVLVVDDMHDFANSLVSLLKLWKYDALAVYEATAALPAAKAFQPRVVILDLVMPQLDGYALAAQLRREPGLEDMAFVAVTGLLGPAHQARCLQEGFVHFLEKPLNLRELQDVLADLTAAYT